MRYLETRVGHHQLPLDPRARDLRGLLASCALHHEITRELTQAIFKQNRCNGLEDPVRSEPTLAALVPLRLKILKSETTDLDLFHFIESWCAAATAFFEEHAPEQSEDIPAATEKSAAPVVSLNAFRIRRTKSWA